MRRLGLGLGLTTRAAADASSGLAILAAGATWADADAAGVFTIVDLTVPALRTGWGLPGFNTRFASVANQDGPEGEPGVRFSENAASGSGSFTPTGGITNLSFGPVKITTRCRLLNTNKLPGGSTSLSDEKSWGRISWPDLRHNGGGRGAPFLVWEPGLYAGLSDSTDPAYVPAGPRADLSTQRYDRWKRTDHVGGALDGWTDIEYEGWICNTGDATGINTQLRASAPSPIGGTAVAGNSLACMDIATVTAVQRRVSEWKDRRDGTTLYSQATNNSRLCLMEDYFLGTRNCVHEGISTGSGLSMTAASTPATMLSLLHVRFRRPSAASQVLKIGDLQLQAGTDGNWHLVQGVTNLDTGIPVSVLPICVGLRVNATTVDLFIDGALVYTGSITLTGTGHAFGGGRSGACFNQIWTKASALTDDEVELATTAMRNEAGLFGPIPIWLSTGQSNANLGGNANIREASGAAFRPGWAMRIDADDDTRPARVVDSTANYYFGVPSGWFDRAMDANEPCVVIHTAHGGQPITYWEEGGDGEVTINALLDEVMAEIGTHLVYVKGMVLVQGEADAAYSTGPAYYAALDGILNGWLADRYGPNVKLHGLMLNSGFTSADPTGIRTAQADLMAAYPDRVYYDDVEPSLLGVDGVHYGLDERRIVGQTIYGP